MTLTNQPKEGSAGPSARHLPWIMALVTGSMFMEILDSTIITTALPSMALSFNTSAVELNLGISAYLLALGVFIPASGWVADRFGAKVVFALAITVFTLASLGCGLSSDFAVFIALRVLQGMAGALMVPVGRLMVLRFTPQDQLLKALSSLVWPALIAPVLGPPIGGFITTHLGWRWIFYLNLPLGIMALGATLWLVPNVRAEQPRRFDGVGFALCGVSTFALLCGLEALIESPGWMSVGLLFGGLVVLALALAHLRRSPHPLIDLRTARIPTMWAALRGGSVFRTTISSAPFLLPLLFQVGFGYDAFHSGLLVLAVFAGNLGMKSITTQVLRRFGYRRVMICNGLLCSISLAACAALSPHWPLALTILVLVLGGMTRSMQFTLVGTLAYADVPKAQMSDANSLFNTTSQLSTAAGIALASLFVRLGQAAADWAAWSGSAQFRLAFLAMAVFSLLGQWDAWRLAPDAAGHMTRGRR